MGMRSQVVLVVKTSFYKFDANAEELLKEADTTSHKDGYSLYVWEYIKWYPDYDNVMSLMKTLKRHPQQYSFYDFVETGNKASVYIRGELLENPFHVQIHRTTKISYKI